MSDYPTRRAAREAEAAQQRASARARRRPAAETHTGPPPAARPTFVATTTDGAAQAGAGTAARASGRTKQRHVKRWRSPGRITIAAAASVFLAGSAMVAMPANAATTPTGVVYSNQLIAQTASLHTQSLHVSASVSEGKVETQKFDSAGFTRPDGSSAITVGGTTNADWAALVLQDGGFPVTANNLTVMLQWMDSENDPGSWWLRNNPLNNGLGSGGGSGFGSYDSLTTAAHYVAVQLRRDIFSGIAAAFDSNAAVSVSVQAIINSPWAGGHYNYGAIWHGVDVPVVAAPAEDW
jgi:hypothetical protein